MNRSEVQDLIQMIERLAGTTWPSGAADAWLPMLVTADAQDAYRAVQEFYDQAEPPRDRITPGYVRRRAHAIQDLRTAKQRLAIEATRTKRAVPPNQEYLRARAALVARLGNLDRPTARVA